MRMCSLRLIERSNLRAKRAMRMSLRSGQIFNFSFRVPYIKRYHIAIYLYEFFKSFLIFTCLLISFFFRDIKVTCIVHHNNFEDLSLHRVWCAEKREILNQPKFFCGKEMMLLNDTY